MRNKKGFTLIELLAVIVILAIIALIATPIVLGIIKDSKKSSNKVSVENYLTAVEQAIARQELNNTTEQLDGTYTIIEDGKKIQKGSTTIAIKYDGTGLDSGKIVIEKGSVKNLIKGKIGNEYATMSNGKVVTYTVKGESTLVKGSSFIGKISSLFPDVDGSFNTASLFIGFYSNGNLPEGITKETLLSMKSVSVSDDNKVKAYSDNSKNEVYVYSENQIYANPDSSYMFNIRDYGGEQQSIRKIYISELDTSKVTNMYGMFYGTNLTSLDLSGFDTSKVTNMYGMFYGTNLTSLDLSSFDTSNVTVMSMMFSSSANLSSLDLSGFDTSKVTNMDDMFSSSSLMSLDLSSFDTSKVDNVERMFDSTPKLKTILVSNKWKIDESILGADGMFSGCGTDHVTVK